MSGNPRTTLSNEEILQLFPDAKQYPNGRIINDGYLEVTRALIHLLESEFYNDEGEDLDVYPGHHRFHRIQTEVDGVVTETDEPGFTSEEGDSIPVPSIVMTMGRTAPPTLGETVELYNWQELGTYETGKKRFVNFYDRTICNLVYDVYCLRDNSMDCLSDVATWGFLWRKNQYLKVRVGTVRG